MEWFILSLPQDRKKEWSVPLASCTAVPAATYFCIPSLLCREEQSLQHASRNLMLARDAPQHRHNEPFSIYLTAAGGAKRFRWNTRRQTMMQCDILSWGRGGSCKRKTHCAQTNCTAVVSRNDFGDWQKTSRERQSWRRAVHTAEQCIVLIKEQLQKTETCISILFCVTLLSNPGSLTRFNATNP